MPNDTKDCQLRVGPRAGKDFAADSGYQASKHHHRVYCLADPKILEVSVVGKDAVHSLWQALWENHTKGPVVSEQGHVICCEVMAPVMLLDPERDPCELDSVGFPKALSWLESAAVLHYK